LRAAQDFHALDVEQLETGARHLTEIPFVDTDRERTFWLLTKACCADPRIAMA
jgi:hypothetical protein